MRLLLPMLVLTVGFTLSYAEDNGKITLAAAANLSSIINDLVADYKLENPSAEVLVIKGSSGKLTVQIENGARFDIFMSADMDYPQKLFDSGLAVEKPVCYASGKLLLFSAVSLPLSNGLSVLTQALVHKIAVANPGTAPYGKAAFMALSNAGLFDLVRDKFVIAENIQQVREYVVTSAEIGFIAQSAVYETNTAELNWVEVNPALYTPIRQGIVLLKNSAGNSQARKFYNYILSKKSRKIFKKYGYSII